MVETELSKETIISALEKWGYDVQRKKIKEEAMEYALEVEKADCPTKDKFEANEKIYEEIADLQIVMQYVPYVYNQEKINRIKAMKIKKFKETYNLK